MRNSSGALTSTDQRVPISGWARSFRNVLNAIMASDLACWSSQGGPFLHIVDESNTIDKISRALLAVFIEPS